MKIFIGGLLIGMFITWGSNILFISWYLRERDEVITDLMTENKALIKKAKRGGETMDSVKPAKSIFLDRIGEMYCITRKRFKSIPLLFGWKLVKEEKDEEYRARMSEIIRHG